MYYTLPININNRRIHICRLVSTEQQFPVEQENPVRVEENKVANKELAGKINNLGLQLKQKEQAVLSSKFTYENIKTRYSSLFQNKRILTAEKRLAEDDYKRVQREYKAARKNPATQKTVQTELEAVMEKRKTATANLDSINKNLITARTEREKSKKAYEQIRKEVQQLKAQLKTLKGNDKAREKNTPKKKIELVNPTDPNCFYRFVVPRVPNTNLFSIAFPDQKILKCSSGFHFDQKIDNLHLEWDRASSELSLHLNYAAYLDRKGIVKSTPNKTLHQNGLSIAKNNEGIEVKLVNNIDLTTPLLKVKILHHDKLTSYEYSFTLALVEERKKFDLALDLGSEAPQAAFKQGNQSETAYVDGLTGFNGYKNIHLYNRTLEGTLQMEDNHAIIGQTLLACLEKIIAVANCKKPRIGLVLTLLVPNIYHQFQLYELIKATYQLIQSLKEDKSMAAILDIEVQTIPASDAAFKGFIANRQAVGDFDFFLANNYGKKQYYLVLDGGKDSMDFSILEHDLNSRDEFHCIYRSGMVGAGQFLSFATMETMLDHLQVSLSTLVGFLKNEPQKSLAFWQEIEVLKKSNRFCDQEMAPLAVIPKDLNQVKQAIHSFIAQKKYLTNTKVKESINQICHRLIKLLEEAQQEDLVFHRVILAGGAFGLKLFQEGIKNALLKEGFIGDKKVVLFDRSISQHLGIEGSLTHASRINHNTDLTGGLRIKELLLSKSFFSRLTGNFSLNASKMTNLRLDDSFFHGIGREQDNLSLFLRPSTEVDVTFRPKNNKISFYIADKHYQLENGGLNGQEEVQISIEQEGYVVRFPKQKNIKLVYNKPIYKDDIFILKSLFTEEGLEEILPLQQKTSTTVDYFPPKPAFLDAADNIFESKQPGEKVVNLFSAIVSKQSKPVP